MYIDLSLWFHDDSGGGDGTLPLSLVAVGLSSVALLCNMFVSVYYGLGLHGQLFVAAIRMLIQLSILGYILVPIFTSNKPWAVALYSCFMTCVAALEAAQRPAHTYKGMGFHVLLAMSVPCFLLMAYMAAVVLGLDPLWDAQYTVPMLGMLLGNATSSVSVGLRTLLEELSSRKDAIELLLALGATRAEATSGAVQRAVHTACLPIINQMSVIGLVSIPGMMTGQILAGQDPSQAARYQIAIMCAIGGATALAATSATFFAARQLVDSNHCIRTDRLLKKVTLGQWLKQLGSWIYKELAQVWALCATCLCCVEPPPAPGTAHKEQRRRQRAAAAAAAKKQGSSSAASSASSQGPHPRPDAAPAAADGSDLRRPLLGGDSHSREEATGTGGSSDGQTGRLDSGQNQGSQQGVKADGAGQGDDTGPPVSSHAREGSGVAQGDEEQGLAGLAGRSQQQQSQQQQQQGSAGGQQRGQQQQKQKGGGGKKGKK